MIGIVVHSRSCRHTSMPSPSGSTRSMIAAWGGRTAAFVAGWLALGAGLMMFIVGIVLTILGTILGFIPILGWLVAMLLSFGLSIVSFLLWIYLMWQAFQGIEWEAPFAGVFARRMV